MNAPRCECGHYEYEHSKYGPEKWAACSVCGCLKFSKPPRDWFSLTFRVIKDVLVIALLAGALYLGWRVNHLVGRVDALVVDTRRVVLSVGGTAAEIRKTAIEQRELAAKSHKKGIESIERANRFIANLDQRINQELLPAATNVLAEAGSALSKTGTSIESTTSDLHAALADIQPTLKNLAAASEGAARVMNDPALTQTIDEMHAASVSTAQTAKNVEGMTADGKAMTQDAREAVHRLTRPARSTWNFIKTALDWLWKGITAAK